jgi:hypothetical protein
MDNDEDEGKLVNSFPFKSKAGAVAYFCLSVILCRKTVETIKMGSGKDCVVSSHGILRYIHLE